MTDVEKMVLWVGLISSIVSIVLSLVATTFAVLVNHRSEKVSDQTIRSLQKIESTTERVSQDTAGLIKGAWDKLLGNFGTPHENIHQDSSSEQVSSGLAIEAKEELQNIPQSGTATKEEGTHLQEVLETLIKTVENLQASKDDDVFSFTESSSSLRLKQKSSP